MSGGKFLWYCGFSFSKITSSLMKETKKLNADILASPVKAYLITAAGDPALLRSFKQS